MRATDPSFFSLSLFLSSSFFHWLYTLGIYLIRGENVVLLGEVDSTSEESSKLNEVSVDDILVAQREEHLRRQEQEKLRNKVLLDRGLQPETLFDDIYT